MSHLDHTLITPEQGERVAWYAAHPEVRDLRFVLPTEEGDPISVNLYLMPTVWVNAAGEPHRSEGPAVFDSQLRQSEYYLAGYPVSPALINEPEICKVEEVIQEPGFTHIGGWAGLARHPTFRLIAESNGARLCAAPDVPTKSVKYGFPGERKVHKKGRRFLYDPHGHSGWVPKSVKTVRGAKNSLLRRKLTGGRQERVK